MKFSRSSQNEPAPRRRQQPRGEEFEQLEYQSAQFRRNQTLSSFRRPATEQESHRHRLHHLADKRRKIGGIFLLVAAISIFLVVLITQFVAQIGVTSATTSIARPLDTGRYEQSINEYYGIHPVERVRFVMNEQGLLAFMSALHPEIEAIALSDVSDVVRAQFSLRFREPIAGWQINGRQFYVDTKGVVFQENYFADPEVQIVDDSGVTPEQGSAVASARLLSFVGRATHEAGERGYKVVSVTLPAGTTRQLEIRVEGEGRPVVRVSVDRGAREQIEDMDRVLRFLDSQNRGAEYIDVRVAGKAVYR
jgi:hypothetical protein